jgi:hypothetical protein
MQADFAERWVANFLDKSGCADRARMPGESKANSISSVLKTVKTTLRELGDALAGISEIATAAIEVGFDQAGLDQTSVTETERIDRISHAATRKLAALAGTQLHRQRQFEQWQKLPRAKRTRTPCPQGPIYIARSNEVIRAIVGSEAALSYLREVGVRETFDKSLVNDPLVQGLVRKRTQFGLPDDQHGDETNNTDEDNGWEPPKLPRIPTRARDAEPRRDYKEERQADSADGESGESAESNPEPDPWADDPRTLKLLELLIKRSKSRETGADYNEERPLSRKAHGTFDAITQSASPFVWACIIGVGAYLLACGLLHLYGGTWWGCGVYNLIAGFITADKWVMSPKPKQNIDSLIKALPWDEMRKASSADIEDATWDGIIKKTEAAFREKMTTDSKGTASTFLSALILTPTVQRVTDDTGGGIDEPLITLLQSVTHEMVTGHTQPQGDHTKANLNIFKFAEFAVTKITRERAISALADHDMMRYVLEPFLPDTILAKAAQFPGTAMIYAAIMVTVVLALYGAKSSVIAIPVMVLSLSLTAAFLSQSDYSSALSAGTGLTGVNFVLVAAMDIFRSGIKGDSLAETVNTATETIQGHLRKQAEVERLEREYMFKLESGLRTSAPVIAGKLGLNLLCELGLDKKYQEKFSAALRLGR